jgi:hypothetical protein
LNDTGAIYSRNGGGRLTQHTHMPATSRSNFQPPNRGYAPVNRQLGTQPGYRPKFSVTPNGDGGYTVELEPGEHLSG